MRGSRGHQVEQRLAGASRRLSLVQEHAPWPGPARSHAHLDREQPRVPFNTPEAATSSSSADSSPELPRRKELPTNINEVSQCPEKALLHLLTLHCYNMKVDMKLGRLSAKTVSVMVVWALRSPVDGSGGGDTGQCVVTPGQPAHCAVPTVHRAALSPICRRVARSPWQSATTYKAAEYSHHMT